MNRNISKFFLSLAATTLIGAAALAGTPEKTPLLKTDTPQTVHDLIQLALDHQTAYQQALESEKIIGAIKLNAVGSFLPSLSTSGRYSNGTTVIQGVQIGGQQDASQSNISLNAQETLFTGGYRYFGVKNAMLQMKNTRLQTEQTRDQLIANIKSAYYSYLAAQRNLDVEKEVLTQKQDMLRLARARFSTGDVIELDVMQAEIDVNQQENAVLTANQGVENAREALNLTVGLDLNSRYPIEDSLQPAMPDINPDSLVQIALVNRPDFRVKENTVKINDYKVKMQAANYLPSANLFYQLNRYETGDVNKFMMTPGNKSTTYGLSLSWTLFDGFTREYNRQNAVIQKRNAMWDEFYAKQQIESTLRQRWRNLQNLFSQIQVSDKNRDLARRQLAMEQERYRVGAIDQLNLRSAQVTFATAEKDYLARVLNFYTTLANLELDLGMPLEEVTQ